MLKNELRERSVGGKCTRRRSIDDNSKAFNDFLSISPRGFLNFISRLPRLRGVRVLSRRKCIPYSTEATYTCSGFEKMKSDSEKGYQTLIDANHGRKQRGRSKEFFFVLFFNIGLRLPNLYVTNKMVTSRWQP